MTRRRRLLGLVLVFAACSSRQASDDEPLPAPIPAAPSAPSPSAGNTSAPTGGGSGSSASDTDVACTPRLSPGDEFYVPCPDAGAQLAPPTPAGRSGGAAGSAPTPRDAGAPPELAPDASTTLPPPGDPDEGTCAQRDRSCVRGHAETTVGSGACAIAGDFLHVQHEACEVCGMETDVIGFTVAVMDCGGCMQIYAEGAAMAGIPLAPSGCTGHEYLASLTNTLSDDTCIDVYAYVHSGVETASGQMTLSGDQVRICRCNRVTDVCVSCAGGACDTPP